MHAPTLLAVPTNRAGVASPRSCRLASPTTTPAPWPARPGSTARRVLRELRVREREKGSAAEMEGRGSVGVEAGVGAVGHVGGSGSGWRGRPCVGTGERRLREWLG